MDLTHFDDAGRVRLRSKAGAVLLEVNYEGTAPWPLAADGTGHSMVLARPSYGVKLQRLLIRKGRAGRAFFLRGVGFHHWFLYSIHKRGREMNGASLYRHRAHRNTSSCDERMGSFC